MNIVVETDASIEEVTEALNDAGIVCYIYKEEDEE